MKIRNGFVSNSSSSSFIVYTKSKELDKDTIDLFLSYCNRKRYPWSDSDHMEITIPLENGHREFDGRFEEYTSFEDRLNFVAETIIYKIYCDGRLDDECQDMEHVLDDALSDIVRERVEGVKYFYVNFDYNLGLRGSVGHSDMNKWTEEIFLDARAMKNFLFGKDSKVEDGNDYCTGPYEDDCPYEYAEGYKFMKKNEKWFKKNIFLSDDERKKKTEKDINRLKREKMLLEMRIKILEEANKE